MAAIETDKRQVASPIYKLTYNGKDISRSLAPYLISLTFEDAVEGECSSVEIECENTDLLFSNGWYPEKSAKLTLEIDVMECGAFIMDEIELKGSASSGDTIIMKALSNVVTKRALKTKRSRAHEKKSLAQIAQSVATANGLQLVGTVPNIPIERVTQRRESDLKFLRRISWDYGIIFSVRDSKLVFTSLVDLEKRRAALTLDRTELMSYSIKDKTDKTFKGAVVRSHNPKKREVVSGNSNIEVLQNKDGIEYTQITATDRLVVHKKAENSQQAEAMADAAYYRANSWCQSGTIEGRGNRLAIAGNNIELTGLGVVGSGIYNMVKICHTVTRDNSWTFSGEVKRLSPVSKAKQRGNKQVQPTASSKVLELQNADGIKYTQIVPIGTTTTQSR